MAYKCVDTHIHVYKYYRAGAPRAPAAPTLSFENAKKLFSSDGYRDERRHRDTFNIVRKKDVKQSSLYIELDREDIIIYIPSSTNTETKKRGKMFGSNWID